MSNNVENKYIINRRKVLGSGATAKVYLGIKSEDGIQFAIKCSRNDVKYAAKTLEDEWNMVKDLNNEYIIKFHELLKNFQRIERVIVMEYCNNGSLYEFTELHQGICDNMFLKVLECLHQGIRYLRDQEILHRDIKPGNMMVHQDNMGHYHVKIVDLGTAKRVGAGQHFKTICGTPEYLHPDMFIRNISHLRAKFNTNVDLWSTGVTLFHAATTTLPFQPLKGSKRLVYDATLKNMYEMKQPGCISAIQNSSDPSDITWYDKLPNQCRLSPMLKELASTFIGHLMDLDQSSTYDRFYEETEQLYKKKRILVFNSLTGELLILYLDSLTYDNVVDLISKEIGHPKENLIILTKNKVLEPLADPTAECLRSIPVKGHLRYTLTDDTVLVVHKNLPAQPHPLTLKESPHRHCERPLASYTCTEDASNYNECLMRNIYQILYSANYIDCQLDCYLATMFSFNQYILVDDLRLMHEVLPWRLLALKDSCSATQSLIVTLEETIDDVQSHGDLCKVVSQCSALAKELVDDAAKCENGISVYYSTIVEQRQFFKYTEQGFYKANDDIANDNLDFLVHLSEEIVNEMKVLTNDRFQDDGPEYKLDVWERQIRLYNYYKDLKSRLSSKSKRIVVVHKYFYDLLKSGLKGMDQIGNWKTFINVTEEKRRLFQSNFVDIINEWKKTSSVQSGEMLRSRILEIKELTEQLMSTFLKLHI